MRQLGDLIANNKRNYYRIAKPGAPKYISIDLGTSNTLVYLEDSGIIFNQKSLIAYNSLTGDVITAGDEAYYLRDKVTQQIEIVEPLLNGVVGNIPVVIDLIKYALSEAKADNIIENNILLFATPSRVTELEYQALEQIGSMLGAKYVIIEEEVKMAALGSGLDIMKPEGHLVVDIGGGTTDVAIISAGETIVSDSTKIAGNYFTAEIIKKIKLEYGLLIGQQMADELKIEISKKETLSNNEYEIVYGRDFSSSLPKVIKIKSIEIRKSMDKAIKEIALQIKEILEKITPELYDDIAINGITLAGGGAEIVGIEKYFSKLFDVPARKSEEPLLAIINGTIKYKEYIDVLIDDEVELF